MTFDKYVCPICSKEIDTLGKLKSKHENTHTKPFICEICNKGFALRVDLSRHIRSRHRTGNEQYRCHVEHCKFTSDRKDNLKRHQRNRHGFTLITSHIKLSNDTQSSLEHPEVLNATPLFSASNLMQVATLGDLNRLIVFLDAGLTVDTRADEGSTVLHCAARAGQIDVVKYLLDVGARVDTRNGSNRLPIHEAILSNSIEMFELLLGSLTQEELRGSELQLMRYFVRSGHIGIIDAYLARLGCDFTDQSASKKLKFAIHTGHDALVAKLLDDPSIDCNHRQGNSYASIHLAAILGREKVMQVFLASSRVDKTLNTSRSRQALHLAAIKGHVAIVEQLIRHPSVDVNCQDWYRATPLHSASSKGHTTVVEQLIRHPKVDFDCRDEYKATPLHHAVSNGHWETVSVLLRHSDSMSDGHCIISDFSPTGLSFNKEDLLRRLLQHPDFGSPNKILPGRHKTMLNVAVTKNDHEVIMFLVACQDIDVNMRDVSGWGPLMNAARDGKVEAVQLLLQHKSIDVNQKDATHRKWTALKWARARKLDEIVDLLLSHGAIDYDAKASTTVPTAARIDNPQNTTLQLYHESNYDQSDDDMDDAAIEPWDELFGMEEGMDE